MRRILYAFIAAAALLAVSCNNELAQFSVTPVELNFTGDAGTQTVSVTAGDTWALKIGEGSSWVSTSKTYGKSSADVQVSVTANAPEARSTEIVFSCSGQSIVVKVNQAAGNAEAEVEKGEF